MEKVRWTDHEKIKDYFTEFRKKENNCTQYNEGRVSGWVLLHRNCIMQHVIEGNIELTGKIGRYKQLLDDLEENRAVKYERGSIRSHLRGTCLGRSYISVT
jgi:hypothetical protein